MTFYDQLKKHLTTKHYVLVTRGDGKYCVFSHITDCYGDYRYSGWGETKEEAMQYIGVLSEYKKKEVNKLAEQDNWKIVEAFSIPEGRFKKGEVVVVADNAKELCNEADIIWRDKKESLIGKECEIKNVDGSDYYVYTPDSTIYWKFPHSALSYPLHKELTSEEVIEEINKLLNKLTNNK